MTLLCVFVNFTTSRFMLNLAPCSHVFFSVLFCIVIGEERAGLYAFRACVCLSCMRYILSFFSASWCQGFAATCDCCTSWTFHLTFYGVAHGKQRPEIFTLIRRIVKRKNSRVNSVKNLYEITETSLPRIFSYVINASCC